MALLLSGGVQGWSVAFSNPAAVPGAGEHLFAPRPIEAIMPPSLRKPWTQWTSAWKLLDPGHPGPHYTSLKAELGTIAASLAWTIDKRR